MNNEPVSNNALKIKFMMVPTISSTFVIKLRLYLMMFLTATANDWDIHFESLEGRKR